MRYRKLTADGDYSFGNGQKDFYRDTPEAVGQAVQTRLLLWLGEWYLDVSEGTAWIEGVLGKHTQEIADATIQQRASDTQGVVSIENFVSVIDPETRGYSATFTVNTIYGPTQVEVANYGNF